MGSVWGVVRCGVVACPLHVACGLEPAMAAWRARRACLWAAAEIRADCSCTRGAVRTLCPPQLQKKKIWEAVQPLLKTDAQRVAGFQGRAMMTSAGPVTAATLAGANIS